MIVSLGRMVEPIATLISSPFAWAKRLHGVSSVRASRANIIDGLPMKETEGLLSLGDVSMTMFPSSPFFDPLLDALDY